MTVGLAQIFRCFVFCAADSTMNGHLSAYLDQACQCAMISWFFSDERCADESCFTYAFAFSPIGFVAQTTG